MSIVKTGRQARKGPSLRGNMMVDTVRGVLRVRKWPRPRPTRTEAQLYLERRFALWNKIYGYSNPGQQREATAAVHGSPFLPRDLFLAAHYGRAYLFRRSDNGKVIFSMAVRNDVSLALDAISQEPMSLLYRNGAGWSADPTRYKYDFNFRQLIVTDQNFTPDALSQRSGICVHSTQTTFAQTAAVTVINEGATSAAFWFENTNDDGTAAPQIFIGKSRGTYAARTAVQAGNFLGFLSIGGWNGVSYASSAQVRAVADEAFTTGPTRRGTRLQFHQTLTGSGGIVEVARFDGAGNYCIAGANIMLTRDRRVRLRVFTVATLPAGVVGDLAAVSDALAPAWNAPLVGGGAVNVKAYFNGAAWVAG